MIDKKTAILIGTAVGAVLGATSAYAYIRVDERSRAKSLTKAQFVSDQVDPADYFKLGMALLAVVRMVGGMLKPS